MKNRKAFGWKQFSVAMFYILSAFAVSAFLSRYQMSASAVLNDSFANTVDTAQPI
jgi:hypothetical protein